MKICKSPTAKENRTRYFLNNGNGTFSDVAIAAGVADTLEGMGAVC
ncbi:MAG: hypothetical protein R3C26_07445 [Calditrichia bacterium]